MLESMKAWRRELHRFPELSGQEVQTGRRVREMLEETHPDEVRVMAQTGLRFVYRCGKKGAKALAFRADMDALPVTEKSIYPHPSENAGRMHACGHDGHMTTLIALGHEASRMRDGGELGCDVVLLFQPAEETTGGAARMIADGALENPHADAVFGFHLMPQVKLGRIALSAGGVMAASTEFDLTFHGVGAHGAMPHLGADAGAAMAAAYLTLQTRMTRAVPPTEPAVLTFGRMSAGTARNVVAERAVMEGILRSYDNGMQQRLIAEFRQIAGGCAAAQGCTADYALHCYYPAVINDGQLVEQVRPLIPQWEAQQPLLTAEDFSYYALERPAVYAFVGCGDEKRNAPLHSPEFDFDERALVPALAWYRGILETLGR